MTSPRSWPGASHFLEHLLFKGTSTLSARQIAEAIDAVGGEMNAFTSREHTAYYTRLPAARGRPRHRHPGRCARRDPAFRTHEFDAERQVILEEILHEPRHARGSRAHPVGRGAVPRPPAGSRGARHRGFGRGADAGTRSPSSSAAGTGPRNLVVVAAGDLDHDADGRGVRRTLGRLRAASARCATSRASMSSPAWSLGRPHRAGARGHRMAGCRPSRRRALRARWSPTRCWAGGMSSRLFQEVREERGLCYSVYSWASTYADCRERRHLRRHGSVPRRRAAQVVDDEVAKLVASGVTEDELAVAKGCIEGSLLLGLEDSGSRMARLGRSLMARDEIVPVDDQLVSHPGGHRRRRRRPVGPGVRRPARAGRRRPRRRRHPRLNPRPLPARRSRRSAALVDPTGLDLDHPVDADRRRGGAGRG